MPPLSHVQLTAELLRAVREAADIVAVASEHTRLVRAGRRYKGLCPLHREKTPSFSVDPDQGLFYCFGCGQGGDAIKLHMALSGDDFPAAITALALRFGVPLPKVAPRRGPQGQPEPDLGAVLAAAAELFVAALESSREARTYLDRRRIPAELRQSYALGFAPDGWRGLVSALHPRFPLADLEAAGLVARPEGGGEPYDRFRNRLIFPIRDAAGRLVGFGGRTLGDDRAKYINTAETDRFHKGSLLFGLDLAKRRARESGRLVLVEGYFDVLAVAAAGGEAVVASMGTALTPEQARLLARYAEEAIVAYDGDEAGEAAARRALPLLLAERLAVRRARFPKGHDPDSLRLSSGEAAVSDAIDKAADLVLLEFERRIPAGVHREPRLRSRAAAAVAELLKPIPDPVLRWSYGQMAADRLGVPGDLLWSRLGVGRAELVKSQAGRAAEPPQTTGSLEEEALRLLLDPAATALDRADLPVAEAFLDPAWRNIYAAFLALYDREGREPTLHELMAGLGGAGDDVDRLARLLLERDVSPGGKRLRESLRELRRRWQKQRLRDLAVDIREAERQGDPARLRALLSEKGQISRELHALGAVESPGVS